MSEEAYSLPDTLNGYPVVAWGRTGSKDLVIVHRPDHEEYPYLVGTWYGGTSWGYPGHGCTSLEEAHALWPEVPWKDQ